jgi:N4-gp56 family major capsid protein
MNLDGKTVYGSSTAAQRNAYLVANADRVLYGAAKANAVSGVHATALNLVDSVADVLTPAIVSLAKRMAKTADPHIRPIRVKNGREYYVMFVPSLAYRDFKNATATLNAHYYAANRGENNPLFEDGDLVWDGVILREVPEIETIAGGACDVAPCFLLGAQALGIGWAQRSKFDFDTFDYGNREGVAVSEIRGVEKLMYNNKAQGVVTVWVANVADT